MADEALKKRWRERVMKYRALEMIEVEEEKKKVEKEQLHYAELTRAWENERAKRHLAVEVTEHHYNSIIQNHTTKDHCDTSPLLLNAVITPVSEPSCTLSSESIFHAHRCGEQVQSARKERDRALALARQYRDLAEACQLDKRTLKNDLEKKVETVRDFWRNKIVEAGSRSGQILRNALIKQ